ncbi:tyrosine-type recombinase/integrase [Acidovorax sp. Be4]|uniref:Tyrosine-type recombinase/integrase n=1 Tax=Acidovorax bellezanensis TaxID=2976702 RepID=A0ABT2PLI6_9BURK|nr:tyrosine-type recombinase/integrase [Acidovorax sp. Be4]MCT9811346.1 tyrosine-type recombinase/integrase [Acidovorax sp. Be4]
MQELWIRGLSRRTRGGTLGTYAGYLTHLLRFCYRGRVDFHELNDAAIHRFTLGLRGKLLEPVGQRRRDDNTVRAICSLCLEFLNWLGQFRRDPDFIGVNGRIRAERRESPWHDSRPGGRGARKSWYWHHASIPLPDPYHRRLPISSEAIEKLRVAAVRCSSSVHQRVRRLAMLTTLEVTGGRRVEVVSLRVEDVLSAAREKSGDLRLLTVKRRGGKEDHRFVPVSAADINFLVNFIRVNRRAIIRRTIKSENDHGYVFVNSVTGMPLNANTITQEISLLAKAAELISVTCAHMFRHRYITKIFIQLIEQHNIEHKDDLRKLLMSGTALKQKLMEWSGHRNMASLDHYVDLAFEEISHIRASIGKLITRRELEGVQDALRDMAIEAENGTLIVDPARLRALASTLAATSSTATDK